MQRAAIAAICEPRLLRVPENRVLALESCRAIAADPAAGLPAFARLEAEQDPDAAWIVRENGKARLAKLLTGSG